MAKSGKMTIFTLSMMTVAAVVSLRGLPLMAKEGLSMIFYILFAAVMFLIPASLVAAELGGAFSNKSGGVYTWIKEAFGSRWGFTAIWLQWIQNVVWYPTVLAFAASALAYLFMDPELANDGTYTGIVILVCYWGATFMTMAGTDVASKVTKYGVILGTLLPGVIIIALGLFWVIQGNPIHFLEPSTAVVAAEKLAGEAPHARLFPHITGLGSVAFLAGIVLLFAGVEVHAVHANEMKNPAKEFPASMFLAAGIIFCLFLAGSMAVAAVIPESKISLTAGLMQAFKQVLDTFHLGFITPLMGLLCAFGAIGGVMSWVGGPSRGLLYTSREGEIPPFMAKVNSKGIQVNILLIQAVIVSTLASLYFIMDNVSVAFFMLSAMTITLYLVVYILMYSAAIKLRYTHPELPRSYKVPGGKFGIWALAGLGLMGVSFALVVGFFPPTNLPVGNPALYVGLVASGMILFIGLPLLIHALKKPEWVQHPDK
ncbi:amino acid permease [uncultured Pseudodesulfovibrio sp.]|uniref:amino acid permease n=1 Tax=uncultured Pseudodesulfovibrio sp. TaxID=2035858 RepID=UPI0029C82761|nr:amino acid permease [uncultured Pseudodesulfovibrio sp.]